MHSLETGIADNPHMYGDLLLTPKQEKELLIGDGEADEEGIKNGVKLWPRGRVVYELDSRLSKQACTCMSPRDLLATSIMHH